MVESLEKKLAEPAAIKRLPPDEVWGLGDAWAGNSVNAVPYRCAPIVTDSEGGYVTAFYSGEGHIAVHRARSGDPSTRSAFLESSRLPFDAHQSISLGTDNKNRLELAFGAHSGSVLMASAKTADFLDGFHPVTLFGEGERFTYPMFLTGGLMLIRRGTASAADILLARKCHRSGEWHLSNQAIISGHDARPWTVGPYLNTPVRSPDGRWHFFIVWRLPPQATGGNPVVNVGMDFISADGDLVAFASNDEQVLTLPACPATVGRCVAVGPGSQLINQCSAAIRPNGSAMAVSYWADPEGVPQYRLVYKNSDGVWSAKCASSFTTKFTLEGAGTLPLPHSRPELLVSRRDRALIIFRSRELGNRLVLTVYETTSFSSESVAVYLLVDEDLGYYEPVVCRDAWRSGQLVIYVQRCNQLANGDGRSTQESAPARLARWDLRNL